MDLLAKAATFVRIVEAGSLSKAARAQRLSLAAISRQLTALEEELGAKLLLRTTRRLRLTDEGRRFHEHASRLVREAEAARASVRRRGSIGGVAVVSTSPTLGVLRIVPRLPELLAEHPSLEIEMRLEDRAADLVSEGVDIAVRAGFALPDTTNLVAHPLATSERLLVASPAYLRRHGAPRSVASLANHPAIFGSGNARTWTFTEDGEARSVTVSAQLRVGTPIAVRVAVLAGAGIAVLPDFVVKDDLERGSLRALLPKATLAPVTTHALHRVEMRGVPRIDAIVAHLRETVPL